MEKLIELLNEYENTDNWENWHQVEFRESKIISKGYWFIGRLIENKKFKRYSAYKNLIDWDYVKFGSNWPIIPAVNWQLYDSILCWLAISDEPIELLISILK